MINKKKQIEFIYAGRPCLLGIWGRYGLPRLTVNTENNKNISNNNYNSNRKLEMNFF